MAYHALTLTKPIAGALASGRSDLPLGDVPGAERCEAGQPVRLLSPEGALAALGLADPENEAIRALARHEEGFTAIDARLFRARIRKARALRHTFGLSRESGPHRLINGAGDGLPGFAADLYGDYGVVYAYARGFFSMGRLLAENLREELGLSGVVLKLRGREATSGQPKQEVIGQPPPEALHVREGELRFEVHLLSGLNVGFFSDMREHRAGLARFVGGKRVLNLFSYTGSLSVAAAHAGASAVTSVDLASGVQRWAQVNFELNQLPLAAHRFETQEVSAFLKKAQRAAETFDVIISDPPTHSAARAGAWSMRKDYPALIERCCGLLAPGGLLWLSANSRDLPPLPEIARGAFERAGRPAQLLSLGGLPPDYPTLPVQPEDRYLQMSLFCVP